MSKIDLRNRTPEISVLPDMRLRVARVSDILNFTVFTPAQFDAEVRLPWGTPDEKYPNCRLIHQDVNGQHPAGSGERGDPTVSPERHPTLLTRVYEEISEFNETEVGNADVSIGQDGLITVTRNWIQFSAGTALYGTVGVDAAADPWSQCVLKTQDDTDDGTLRRIKRVYISQGVISTTDEFKNEGALNIKTIVSAGVPPTTPSGYTVISEKVEYPNGNPVYSYTYAKGDGVIETRIQQRDGGLRLETWVSLGDTYDPMTMQPPGILMVKDVEALDGTYRFTATCMQNSTGGDPTDGIALTYQSKQPFRYPGRAKAYMTAGTGMYTITGGGTQQGYPFPNKLYDVFLSPPVDVELDADIFLTYGVSPSLNLGTAIFYNPDSWATMRAQYQPYNTIATVNEIKSLAGFRAINSGTALLFFAATETIATPGPAIVFVTAFAYSCLGQTIYPLSSGSLVVTGGPVAPDLGTWTLSARLDPAFIALDGTQYYRQTQVVAFVPAQSALPV